MYEPERVFPPRASSKEILQVLSCHGDEPAPWNGNGVGSPDRSREPSENVPALLRGHLDAIITRLDEHEDRLTNEFQRLGNTLSSRDRPTPFAGVGTPGVALSLAVEQPDSLGQEAQASERNVSACGGEFANSAAANTSADADNGQGNPFLSEGEAILAAAVQEKSAITHDHNGGFAHLSSAITDTTVGSTRSSKNRIQEYRLSRVSLGTNADINGNRASVKNVPDMMEGALALGIHSKADKGRTEIALLRFQEKYPIRGRIRRVVRSPLFEVASAGAVLVSVVLIGVEVEVKARWRLTVKDLPAFFAAQAICLGLFAIELLMRALDAGFDFFRKKEWKWNVFDTVCVCGMALDMLLEAYSPSGSASLRVVRLLRILRALRLMRATSTSREFRKMSYALQYSVHTLFWVCVLLSFVMYFFATAFTQATVQEIEELGIDANSQLTGDTKILDDMFGTLTKSAYTLFMAISSGRDWWECIQALAPLHEIFSVLFLLFVAVTLFGVMNVVTGVFVESALQSVQHYKELLIQESMKSKAMYMDHLQDVFLEIDIDNSGSITLEEMDDFLRDPILMQYLESMDIQPDDARTLFSLLDKDGSGEVSIHEFCQGCLRLKGEAKSFDIQCIIYENQRLLHKWREYMTYLEVGFPRMLAKTVEKAIENQQSRPLSRPPPVNDASV